MLDSTEGCPSSRIRFDQGSTRTDVQYTPNDPVAGNPSSLMGNLVHLDFSSVLVNLPLGNALQGRTTEVEAGPMADTEGITVDKSDFSVSSASPKVAGSEENEESSTETSERQNKIGIVLGFGSCDQGDSRSTRRLLSFPIVGILKERANPA